MLVYPIVLTPDDNDTVMATSPDFPEVTTFGEDNDDALLHAIDALEEAIAARIAHREDLPHPSKGKHIVALPSQTAVKVLLYRSMRERDMTKAKLARALNWHAPQVDRLFDVRHASRLDQLDSAFNALGLSLEINVKQRAGTQS